MAEQMIGIIGGSGLGFAMEEMINGRETVKADTPFGAPSCEIITGKIGKNRVCFLNRHGRGHRFSPSTIPYAANIYAMKAMGVHTIIATAAVGSLRDEIKPGDLVIVDQFIDKTFKRMTSFFGKFGAVHTEFAVPVCPKLCQMLYKMAKNVPLSAHEKGTYVCMEGPQFSTRAESLMHRSWGADLIGMTAMPEAKLAREAQICYGLIALVSDYDCWWLPEGSSDKQTLLKEILSNLKSATDNCLGLVEAAINGMNPADYEDCPCRESLELAVWTQQDCIDEGVKKELQVLFE